MAKKGSFISKSSDSVGIRSLVELIPKSLSKELVESLSLDHGVKKLTHTMLFNLILYSLFSPIRISLRRMQEHAQNPRFAYFTNSALEYIGYTSIRSALLRADVRYFQQLYEHVFTQLSLQYSARDLSKRYSIKLYDSTMVAVFAHLFNGMRVGNTTKNKRQIKFTTELSSNGLIHMRFFSDQTHLSEEKALKETIESRSHSSDDIIVFDAGMQKRKTFQQFDQGEIQFITRLKKNTRYQLLHTTPTAFEPLEEALKETLPQTAPVIEDNIVHLAQSGEQWLEHPFRMITVDIGEEGPIFLLTNILSLDPHIIAAIYRMRWEIEVFFRFLKQEMDFTHFISYDPKAIEIMCYSTMIAAMLVLIYRQKTGIRSFKKAKIMLLTQLDDLCMLTLLETDVGTLFLKEQLLKSVNRTFSSKK